MFVACENCELHTDAAGLRDANNICRDHVAANPSHFPYIDDNVPDLVKFGSDYFTMVTSPTWGDDLDALVED